MGRSRKTHVIEAIFNARWDEASQELSDPKVTLDEVASAIRDYNASDLIKRPSDRLSDRNPANFMKDLIRKTKSANSNWPTSVLDRGYTGRQIPVDTYCFEFVPLSEGQETPFSDDSIPAPSELTPRFLVQSAGLPMASRRLGRADEPWLMQVCVRLGVIESHLAFCSDFEVQQVDHLQMSVKLSAIGSELDALYLATIGRGDDVEEALVTCEAKGRKEDISRGQIVRQVRAAFQLSGVTQNLVIPIAVKIVAPSHIHIVEFEAVRRNELDDFDELTIATESVIVLKPEVPGIN